MLDKELTFDQKYDAVSKLIDMVHMPAKDRDGKIIGFNECFVPGIMYVERGEMGGSSREYLQIEFEDGDLWRYEAIERRYHETH